MRKGSDKQSLKRRAGGVVRMLVVGSATLAILIVCFSIYQFGQLPTEPAAHSGHARFPSTPTDSPALDPATGSESPPLASGNGVVGTGREVKLSIYPREGTKARMEIAVRTYHPTGNAANEYLLVDPEVRLRTTDGRAVRVTAREGILEARQKGAGKLDPQRGRLLGDVLIEVDRLTEQERSKLPPTTRHEIDPYDLVRAELDEIEFDLEYSRVFVPRGKLKLAARDIDFIASDLEVRFDEEAGHVEYLRISQGGRIELRGTDHDLGFAMPGGDVRLEQRSTLVDWLRNTLNAHMAVPRAADQPPAPANPASITVAEDGTLVYDPRAAEPKALRPPVRYFAHFEQQVNAREQVGDITKSHLEADVLEILRSISDQDKERVQSPAAQPGPQEVAAHRPVQRTVVEWEGRLVLEACSADDARCAPDVESRVVAKGSPVRVFSANGDAAGAELRFEPAGSKVWLEGTPSYPVVVRTADQGTLTGRKVYSEQTDDAVIVRIQGPGVLQRGPADMPSGGATLNGAPKDTSAITFDDQLILHGRFETRTRVDLAGGITTQRFRVLDRAELTGGVRLREDDNALEADELTVHFRPPHRPEDRQEIERVEGRGHVAMSGSGDRLTCGEIDLTFATGSDGKVTPVAADARREVEALQQGRIIRARDQLMIEFDRAERLIPPFDAAKAHAAAVSDGYDPATVDSTAKRQEHDATRRPQAEVKHVRAAGDVVVLDSNQGLDLRGQQLDCRVANGKELIEATVTGTEGYPASVQLKAFTITGAEIKLNAIEERADVPGAGRLTFRSRKDLNGRQLEDPIPISVTWKDWMRYRGTENQAVFSGNIHAESGATTSFDANQLLIEFDDVGVATSKTEASRKWWVFQDLVDSLTAKEPRVGSIGNDPRLAKEPAYMLATGKAVAEMSELDALTGERRSRARLSGGKLSVNLRRDVSKMLIEGPGDLQLEDFRPPDTSAGSAAVKDGGLFGVDENSGPSKTLIEWRESMWYDFAIDQTRFEGDVSLKHFSGAELQRIFGGDTHGGAIHPGRSTFLTCNVLTADFSARGKRVNPAEETRMGGLSAERLRQFRALGAVTLHDKSEGLSLAAQDLAYEKDRSILIVQGSNAQKAHVILQRHGEYPKDVMVERFFFNLKTKAFEMDKVRVKGL